MEEIKEEIKEEINEEFREIEERFLARTFSNKMTIGVLEKTGLSVKSLSEIDLETTADLSPFIKLLNAMLIDGEPFTKENTEMAELLLYEDVLKDFLDRSSRLMAAKDRLKSKRLPKR